MKVYSVNPSNGERIAEFESATTQAAVDAVSRARLAQKAWWERSSADRADILRGFGQMLENRKNEVIAIISSESGRIPSDAEAEVMDVADAVGYYIDRVQEQNQRREIAVDDQFFPETTISTRCVPHGVIAMIMPWNFPFYAPMMNTLPALLAGNAVIIKPSEYTTMVGAKIVELLLDAGLPRNIIQYLPGSDKTGEALIAAKPDKIFFVGSVETGRKVIASAGTTPVQVELGGNSAAIVLEDSDLDLAARAIAWAGLYSSGQDCVGIKRVYVRSECLEDFESRLLKVISGLTAGKDYGPYIRAESRSVVQSRVAEAAKAGADVILAPEVLERGYFATPAVVRMNSDDLDLTRFETFGNVLPIMEISSDDEAIERANDTTYGLSSCLFTQDAARADRFVNELQTGMVFVNDPFVNLPGGDHWTGWRNSGFGTMESKLEQMQKKKVVSMNWSTKPREFWY